LAEAVRDKQTRPITVIYPAGLDILPLVIEAQGLLPADKRWNATFATFYSRIYSSFDVKWRFLLHETTDARQARRDAHALVIDLCKAPLPLASGGDLVQAARDGRLPKPKSVALPEPASAAAPIAPTARTGVAKRKRSNEEIDTVLELAPLEEQDQP